MSWVRRVQASREQALILLSLVRFELRKFATLKGLFVRRCWLSRRPAPMIGECTEHVPFRCHAGRRRESMRTQSRCFCRVARGWQRAKPRFPSNSGRRSWLEAAAGSSSSTATGESPTRPPSGRNSCGRPASDRGIRSSEWYAWVRATYFWIRISTRRFFCRPSAVSFNATGVVWPRPRVVIKAAEMVWSASHCLTAAARRSDST